VRSRLTRELEVIKKWSLAPYSCSYWTSWKKRGGAGFRGGARVGGSSIVTYCLGISARVRCAGAVLRTILNESAGDCPDIDIDICGARRE